MPGPRHQQKMSLRDPQTLPRNSRLWRIYDEFHGDDFDPSEPPSYRVETFVEAQWAKTEALCRLLPSEDERLRQYRMTEVYIADTIALYRSEWKTDHEQRIAQRGRGAPKIDSFLSLVILQQYSIEKRRHPRVSYKRLAEMTARSLGPGLRGDHVNRALRRGVAAYRCLLDLPDPESQVMASWLQWFGGYVARFDPREREFA